VSLEPCQTCRGQGEIIDKPCNVCNGSGRIKTTKKIKLDIPPGVEDGLTLQMRGEGEPLENGVPGDLLIRTHIKPHSLFEKLDNGHLLYNLNLNFTDLALGTDVRVPTLEDQEKLFKLISPEDIGIELTEGFMMEPEASVTAMVFAHPDARYFNVLR